MSTIVLAGSSTAIPPSSVTPVANVASPGTAPL
jgi:hypothetical protein